MDQKDDSSISNKSLKQFETFFNIQLNRTYCAKSHLHERLQELLDHTHFEDLDLAIAKTTADVEKQIDRMDLIFKILEIEPGFEDCKHTINIMEEANTQDTSFRTIIIYSCIVHKCPVKSN